MKTIPWRFLVVSSLTACACYADDTAVESTPTDHLTRAAIDKGFQFQQPAAVIKASPSITATSVSLPSPKTAAAAPNDLTDATQATPVQMPAYLVRDLPDHTFRELNESVAVRELLAPCTIVRKDISHDEELQFLSAPVGPVDGETAGHLHQARFPLITLAW